VTTAPIAAVFLSPTDAELKRVQTAGADERAALADELSELGGVARVLSAAGQHGRDIDLVTLAHPDIASLFAERTRPDSRSEIATGDRVPPTPRRISELLWDLERRALTQEG
jgi:hypothetical protein